MLATALGILHICHQIILLCFPEQKVGVHVYLFHQKHLSISSTLIITFLLLLIGKHIPISTCTTDTENNELLSEINI